MARLNPGGFAAGFESGFGMVSRAKKDKRDYELKQQQLEQQRLDREQDQRNKDRTFGLNERNIQSQIKSREISDKESGTRLEIAKLDLKGKEDNLNFLKKELAFKEKKLKSDAATIEDANEIRRLELDIKNIEAELAEKTLQNREQEWEDNKTKRILEEDAKRQDIAYKENQIQKQNREENLANARLAEVVYGSMAQGEMPLQSQLDQLNGTQYDVNKFLDVEFQDSLKFIAETWSDAANPNTPLTIAKAVENPKVLDALDKVLHEDLNINLEGLEGKHLAQIIAVPSELIKEHGLSPDGHVYMEMIVTKEDGSVYIAPATMGRQNNPNDPVTTVSVTRILEHITGGNMLVGTLKNLESTGNLKKIQRMASSRIRVADERTIRVEAAEKASKAWDSMDTITKGDLQARNVSKEDWVMEQVNLQVKARFQDIKSRDKGVSLLDLNQVIDNGIDEGIKLNLLENDFSIDRVPLDMRAQLFNESLEKIRTTKRAKNESNEDYYQRMEKLGAQEVAKRLAELYKS